MVCWEGKLVLAGPCRTAYVYQRRRTAQKRNGQAHLVKIVSRSCRLGYAGNLAMGGTGDHVSVAHGAGWVKDPLLTFIEYGQLPVTSAE